MPVDFILVRKPESSNVGFMWVGEEVGKGLTGLSFGFVISNPEVSVLISVKNVT